MAATASPPTSNTPATTGDRALTELGWLGSFTLQFASIELDDAAVARQRAHSLTASGSAPSSKARSRSNTLPNSVSRRRSSSGSSGSGSRRTSVETPLSPLTRLPSTNLAKVYKAAQANPETAPQVPLPTAIALCLLEAANHGSTATEIASWIETHLPYFARQAAASKSTLAAAVTVELAKHSGCFVVLCRSPPASPVASSPTATVDGSRYALSELHAASLRAMMRPKRVRRKSRAAASAGERDITAPRSRARSGSRGKKASGAALRRELPVSLRDDPAILSDSSLTDGTLSSDLDFFDTAFMPDVDAILGPDWSDAGASELLVVSSSAAGNAAGQRPAMTDVNSLLCTVGGLDEAETWTAFGEAGRPFDGRSLDDALGFEDALSQYAHMGAMGDADMLGSPGLLADFKPELSLHPNLPDLTSSCGSQLFGDEPWSALAFNAPIYGLTA